MNFIDILLLIPLAWAAYRGFKRGLIIEVATLVALGLGIFVSVNYSALTENLVRENLEITEKYLPIIGFGLTFLLIVALVFALAKLLERFIDLISLTIMNKLAGASFGIIKMGLILSMIILIVDLFDRKLKLIPPETRQASMIYGPVSMIAPLVIPGISDSDWYDALMSRLPDTDGLLEDLPFQDESEEETE